MYIIYNGAVSDRYAEEDSSLFKSKEDTTLGGTNDLSNSLIQYHIIVFILLFNVFDFMNV